MDVSLPNADIKYIDNFLDNVYSTELFNYLNGLEIWETHDIVLFGKKCRQNRQTMHLSYPGLNYKYSGIDNVGRNIEEHPLLIKLMNGVQKYIGEHYKLNYILGNRYLDGNNTIGMHSDDERDLHGPIVSISLGSERFFDLKSKVGDIKHRINLKNGSMLIMDGDTQQHWKHGVPIQKRIKTTRINLTLRCIKT